MNINKKCTDNKNPFAFSNGYCGDKGGGAKQNDWETNGSTGGNAHSLYVKTFLHSSISQLIRWQSVSVHRNAVDSKGTRSVFVTFLMI